MRKGIDHIGITVTYLCHDGEGNYLLQKRSTNCRDEHGAWDGGAGAVELHDSVENTLRKEIREELCTDVLEYEFLGYRDVHREHAGEKTHWIALDFKVRIDRAQVQNGEPHKFDDIQWFALDALPEPLHSQLPSALRLYGHRL
ncbi:MAG TPA: NUDIX domain-containing protein [Candidatus Paceibacterota bacterium]|nr:NUDIX domain-containing protein [Candidatus Paceibacterota bacterium]